VATTDLSVASTEPGAMADLRVRRYDDRDGDAVLRLNEAALAGTGTDPSDIPGSDDLRGIGESYIAPGGDFLVGIVPDAGAGTGGTDDGSHSPPPPRTFDGRLVAMGGFVPATAGREEERSAAGAAELHRMRVAPSRQRRGYGTRLLGALEARAAEAGFERLFATTAARQRAAAAFYPDAGYRETGRSTHGDYELIHFEKRL